MNKSPINYLVTLAIGCIFWIFTGLLIAEYLSDTVTLATITIEKFILWYRLGNTVAGIISLIWVFYWFSYGSKDSTAGDLDNAKKFWYKSFIIHIIVAVAILFAEVVGFLNEGIVYSDYLIIFVTLSLHTYFFFWLCTFLMSPRAVKYIVPLR